MTNIDISINDEALANAAFERVLPDLMALGTEELDTINLDIPQTVITVFGVCEEVKKLREAIIKELPGFDISQVDRLQDFTLALSVANARYMSATKGPNDLEDLANDAARLRERYLSEARFFTHHGIINEDQLEQLKGSASRKNVSTDLLTLANLLRDKWKSIEGKTPTTLEDLEYALRTATRLQRVMGLKQQGPSHVAEVADHRVRAYSKLLDVYEAIQRAVAYLRGARYDANDIVPNLHPGRPGSRRKVEEETEAPAASAAPTAATSRGTQPFMTEEPFSASGPFIKENDDEK